MDLLIDSDVFCKLAACRLLKEVADHFGVELSMCGRLPALPFMLQRGRLVRQYGDDVCRAVSQIVEMVPAISQPASELVEKLTSIESIDPGEALIFSAAAEDQKLVLTGDKRALIALKDVPEFIPLLEGRIIVFETVLLVLCERMGHEEVYNRLRPIAKLDQMVKICFPNLATDPTECLSSYFRSLSQELLPFRLWNS